MREQIYIRLDADDPPTWLINGSDGSVHQGFLREAATMAIGRQVIILVPATEVTLAVITVPTRSRARIAAAAPYQLEEQLAADVDDMHFACGERDAQGKVAVAMVARARMASWLNQLKEAGIEPDVIVPECLALPWQESEWTLLVETRRTTVRNGLQSGFGIETDGLAFLLPRALQGEHKPQLLRVIDVAKLPLPRLDISQQREEGDEPPLALLARSYRDVVAINLLQGNYGRRERLDRLWRPWRAAVVMLMIWIVLQFSTEFVRYHQLSQEQRRLHTEINDIYLKTFPDAKRVVDARVQMEQRLGALRASGSDSEAMDLLTTVSGTTAAMGNTQIQRLIYHDGEMNLFLLIPDLQHLEQLKQRLAEQGRMNVEILSATSHNEQVEAELHIKRKTV